ncbi:hypothetical protein T265_07379 [Opisthorchis viverrini]|uniref:Uncharacterized protein n=1 Tax=Opisthorchis viverrini TaxID=6198 RepID=A0A074ZCT2_OPIVI|nr:hypothetical protein T265_07379 [Opisthorchis viverrini]KER25086.1 hypothetical protein T265_07379 [Opisthorchis viverrini]
MSHGATQSYLMGVVTMSHHVDGNVQAVYVPIGALVFWVITVIDGIKSVFSSEASLSYNYQLFESLFVRKIIKMDWEGIWCQFTT